MSRYEKREDRKLNCETWKCEISTTGICKISYMLENFQQLCVCVCMCECEFINGTMHY